ncbi:MULTISPECIES: inorganic phosphate transporter [unclassified Pseudomonas]|uniref:inorganic phosphate transporter n=1 Tax=unclassified Pseudomonas TaxID=196821 RepID=UPI0021BAA0D0|nr:MULTISPECIES: inorganic phosphate transporter [unclassified Pseudomonas]MCT8165805.1 inorganic phosphate transporter [Pseudomonas sp. HD6422]MCT8184790.1 inorganic phosphate transporter [Pseudomonas sp. HD6421]
MATPSLASQHPLAQRARGPQLSHKPGRATLVMFFGLLLAGIAYTAWSLKQDVSASGTVVTTVTPFLLLGLALLIALGFEFVNGFHDTANAVATVIYTHSLPAPVAVMWSGLCNFLGVLLSSGAVAFGIIALLPVELLLKVGSSAGFAMVFALLLAAIIWNLGTWWLGLPASSSHTLIGSIIGVGVANALMHGREGTSGVDWSQASKVGYALLLSPLVGFVCAALLLLALRALVKRKALYQAPEGRTPPPWWIRAVLILTCTGVSFAHGSNDGQKGTGLIMLILVGTLPMAYALNKTMPNEQALQFSAVAEQTRQALLRTDPRMPPADVRQTLTAFISSPKATSHLLPALAELTGEIGTQVEGYGSLKAVPAEAMANVRNDMYLASETIRLIEKNRLMVFDADTRNHVQSLKTQLDDATRYIPLWVKVAVAIALGLGTMVGWRRIVVTVGEKIGKTHLSYAQGASAEVVAMCTIGAADMFGLPVSTTHVLSSGVAGTMVANGSGVQRRTLINLLLAWVLTLPAAMLLAGSLYWLLSHAF